MLWIKCVYFKIKKYFQVVKLTYFKFCKTFVYIHCNSEMRILLHTLTVVRHIIRFLIDDLGGDSVGCFIHLGNIKYCALNMERFLSLCGLSACIGHP